jgi:hypothetical protein
MCLINLWQGGPSGIMSPTRTSKATNTLEDIPQTESQPIRRRLSRTTEATNTVGQQPDDIPQTESQPIRRRQR